MNALRVNAGKSITLKQTVKVVASDASAVLREPVWWFVSLGYAMVTGSIGVLQLYGG